MPVTFTLTNSGGVLINSSVPIRSDFFPAYFSNDIDLPLGDLAAGYYILRVSVNIPSAANETRYTNNTAVSSFWVGAPSGPELIRVNCALEALPLSNSWRIRGHAEYDNGWVPPELCADNSANIDVRRLDPFTGLAAALRWFHKISPGRLRPCRPRRWQTRGRRSLILFPHK